uniref:Uncharacterized protein n=1 Tax=Plectus sambesii TaxID=2011161 RepID=A0A914VLL5_9BILA
MKPYANLAVKSGYEVYFVEPDTKWKFNVKECFRKNLHLVEKSTIQYMLDNYEKKVSLEHLIRPIKL